jgi:DNA mismatch repair ATPase MutL
VRDLFYKWPVRRKQAELSQNFHSTTLSQVRRQVEALAVVNHGVAFHLYDMDGQHSSNLLDGLLSLVGHSSMSARVSELYGSQLVKVSAYHLSR